MRRNIISLLSVVLVGTWILSLSCFGGVVRDLSFLPEVNEKDGGVVRPLPYDAEVEYLESTGTQYIITSTELSAGMSIGLTAQVSDTATGGYKWFFGQYGNGVARYGWYSPTPGEFSMLAQGVARIVNPQDPTKKFSVTGIVNGFSGKSVNVGIFGCSEESTVSGKSTKTRVFNFSVQNNDEILCDLIPVRFTNERGETEGAMYDKVSGQLFRNQGTGAFIIGPDVRKVSSRIALNSRETMPTARDYVQDGLVAMWDGIENAGWGQHDPNATVWMDLSGNEHGIELGNATVRTDSVTLNSESIGCTLPEVSRPEFTVEVVCHAVDIRQGAVLWIANPSWIGGLLVSWSTYGQTYFPWKEILRDKTAFTRLSSLQLSYKDGLQQFFVNGQKAAEMSISIDPRNVLTRLKLGEFNGSIVRLVEYKAVRLYNKWMSEAEIAANYAVDKARFGIP